MNRGDGADRSLEQPLEQPTDRAELRSLRTGRFVESQHGVPARVEGEVAAGDEHPHPHPLVALGDLVQIGSCLVTQHPYLGMDDSSTRGRYRHDRLIEKGKGPAGLRQADLAGLAEDGELASVGAKRVDQFHGPLATCFIRGIAQARDGECGRCGEQRLQVERERDGHGRFQPESGRRAHGIDERQPVGRLEHYASVPSAAAISPR